MTEIYKKFNAAVKNVKEGRSDIVALQELLPHLSEEDRKKIIAWSSATGLSSRDTKTRTIALPSHGSCLQLRQPADTFEYESVQGDMMIAMDSSIYPLRKDILEVDNIKEKIEFQEEARQLLEQWETVICPACKGKGFTRITEGQLTTISDCRHCNKAGKIRQVSMKDAPKFFEELLGIKTYIVQP